MVGFKGRNEGVPNKKRLVKAHERYHFQISCSACARSLFIRLPGALLRVKFINLFKVKNNNL
jgi:hypothetical protein